MTLLSQPCPFRLAWPPLAHSAAEGFWPPQQCTVLGIGEKGNRCLPVIMPNQALGNTEPCLGLLEFRDPRLGEGRQCLEDSVHQTDTKIRQRLEPPIPTISLIAGGREPSR
jgi:hypothetical protein